MAKVRFAFTAVLILGLLAVVITKSAVQPIEVYFTYPGKSQPGEDNPERILVDLLAALHKGDALAIAMYSMTDNQLRDALLAAWERSVDIRIYRDNGRACNENGSDTREYLSVGIPIRTDTYSGLMHHKFAVINADTVITGSYNWTASADEDNYENLVIIRDASVGQDFLGNFELLWYSGNALESCR